MEKIIIFDFYKTLYNPKQGELFRGTKSLLIKLRPKYKIFLVTTYSKNRKRQIRQSKIEKFLAKIIICAKKNSVTYTNLAVNPKNALIVGDRLDEEISIGKQLGTKTLQVNSNKENPILTIKKYLESDF